MRIQPTQYIRKIKFFKTSPNLLNFQQFPNLLNFQQFPIFNTSHKLPAKTLLLQHSYTVRTGNSEIVNLYEATLPLPMMPYQQPKNTYILKTKFVIQMIKFRMVLKNFLAGPFQSFNEKRKKMSAENYSR